MFHRQQKEMFLPAAIPKLGAIGVLFPANTAQQFPIGGTKRDEIAPAAMVRAEDKPLRRQLRKSALDVGCAKTGAVPADGDDFVVATLRDSFDRVLKALREIAARLPVNVRSDADRLSGRCEIMKISLRFNLRSQTRYTQKRPCRRGERTPREVDVDFVGEYEKSSSGHAFGYETATVSHKHFRWSAR